MTIDVTYENVMIAIRAMDACIRWRQAGLVIIEPDELTDLVKCKRELEESLYTIKPPTSEEIKKGFL